MTRGRKTVILLAEQEAFSEFWEVSLDGFLSKWYWFSTLLPSLATPLRNENQKCGESYDVIPGPNKSGKCHKSLKKAEAHGISRTNPPIYEDQIIQTDIRALGPYEKHQHVGTFLSLRKRQFFQGSPLTRICLTSRKKHQRSIAPVRPVS